MITNIPITIDLNKKYTAPINLVQGEKSGRRLSFTILSGGVAVNLSGRIVVLVITKPDGNAVYNTCVITTGNGKCYADISGQMVTTAGEATLQLRIFSASVNGIATSATAGSMYDTTKSWTANAYAGGSLFITAGPGVGQVRNITANSETQIFTAPNWVTNPTSASTYSIIMETGLSAAFTASISASPNVDDKVLSSNEFTALEAAIATAAGLDVNAVHKTGDEAVYGIKNFNIMPYYDGSPISYSEFGDTFSFTKFADGRLIQTLKLPVSAAATTGVGALFLGDISPIPYAVEFVGLPNVNVDILSTSGAWLTPSSAGAIGTSPSFYVWSLTSATVSGVLNVTAIGRWK